MQWVVDISVLDSPLHHASSNLVLAGSELTPWHADFSLTFLDQMAA